MSTLSRIQVDLNGRRIIFLWCVLSGEYYDITPEPPSLFFSSHIGVLLVIKLKFEYTFNCPFPSGRNEKCLGILYENGEWDILSWDDIIQINDVEVENVNVFGIVFVNQMVNVSNYCIGTFNWFEYVISLALYKYGSPRWPSVELIDMILKTELVELIPRRYRLLNSKSLWEMIQNPVTVKEKRSVVQFIINSLRNGRWPLLSMTRYFQYYTTLEYGELDDVDNLRSFPFIPYDTSKAPLQFPFRSKFKFEVKKVDQVDGGVDVYEVNEGEYWVRTYT